MRYSLMLQVVATIATIFVGTAALFAWLQSRPSPASNQNPSVNLPLNS